MKENKYDDPSFFEQYGKMDRSERGLQGAGEWYVLQKMLPPFENKKVLDLGCGYGWHCRYAIEQGAQSVVGVDISEKMLEKAKQINNLPGIEYIRKPIEDINFNPDSFDVVISSLTFHYISDFDNICEKVHSYLTSKGSFVFSVEHPVFTAQGRQDWHYNEKGERMHWPVDSYFDEGKRKAVFLGEEIAKYHRTLSVYINTLLRNGFELAELAEPMPSEEVMGFMPEMKDEFRRPMMLLISAIKK